MRYHSNIKTKCGRRFDSNDGSDYEEEAHPDFDERDMPSPIGGGATELEPVVPVTTEPANETVAVDEEYITPWKSAQQLALFRNAADSIADVSLRPISFSFSMLSEFDRITSRILQSVKRCDISRAKDQM